MASTNETETFQHYQVLRKADGTLHELGRGAMGVTYKAFDTNLRSYVALKVINALHLDSETARARFLREARAAAALRHRNIASVYHLGNDDQSFFYAMEFVDGQTLEALVKEQNASLPPPVALQIALQVSRALGAAGKQGLVHRDIKPANIMVEREDDDEDGFVVKVIDFGLARSAAGGEGSAHITMGGFVGTPQYASPEQLEEKDLDIRSDIYSLGVTLWYMLVGRPPFVGPLGSVFIQQMTKEPPWDQMSGQPEQIKALLARLLQKDPDKRPQSPTELRREIETCLRAIPASALRGTLPPVKTGTDSTIDSLTSLTKTRIAVPPTVSPPSTASHPPAPTVPPAPTLTPTPAADSEVTMVRPAVVTTGTLLSGRYNLGDLVGQGNNGRVFHARDLARESRAVAVKVLHANVLTLNAERTRLTETLATLHRAPHPHLMEVESFDQAPGCRYLVEEWISGFTLVDLLRARGQLPVREMLLLLAQTSAAADHAFAHGLSRLELSLHQILVHFPSLTGPQAANRTLLGTTVDKWPTDFSLKLDALGISREPGDSVTWSGEMTMLPSTPMLGRDTQTSIRGLVESSPFFALGLLTFELLNGAPPTQGRGEDGRGIKFAALPSLNEDANDVLRRMLTPNPGFTSGAEFFQALCEASGVSLRVASATTAPGASTAPEITGGDVMHSAASVTMQSLPEESVASETMISPRDVPQVEEPAASRFDTIATTRTPEPPVPPMVEEVSAESIATIPDEAAPVQPIEARHDTPAAEIFEPPTPAVSEPVETEREVLPEPAAPVHDRADISLDEPAETEHPIEARISEKEKATEKPPVTLVTEEVVPVPILRQRTDRPLTADVDEEAPPRNLMLPVAGGSMVVVVLAILVTLMLRHGSQPSPTPPTRPVVIAHPSATPVATPRIVSVEPSPVPTPVAVSTPVETPTPMPVVVSTPPPPTPESTPAVAATNSTPPPPVEATASTPPPVEPKSTRNHDVAVAHDRETEQHAADKREADRREADQRAADKRDAEQHAVADKRDTEKKEAREPVVRKESKPEPTPKPKPVVAKATPAPKKEASKSAATPDPNSRSGPGIGFMR